jgi:myo-inositol catabolism protein IolS
VIYRPFGKTGWNVSAISLGSWNIGNQWGPIDDVTAFATIHAALDQGINLIDTAEAYGIPQGLSEERLGVALAGIRGKYYIVTKIGNWARRSGHPILRTHTDHIVISAQACLYRLRTDWLDVVLCHEGEIEDPHIYLEAFEMLKQQGKLRYYGISTNSIEVLKRFNANGNCSVVETDYSLVNRKPETDILPYCQENGIAVMIRGPLAKGLLAGKYDINSTFDDSIRKIWNPGGSARAQFERGIAAVEALKRTVPPGEEMVTTALRYVISHPAAPVAIPGAKSPLQVAMNAQAGDRLLSPEEMARILAAMGSPTAQVPAPPA